MKKLTKPRRCNNHVEGLHFDTTSFCRKDRFCPNYVNQKKPRRYFWEREGAQKRCWAYICDWCWEDLPDNEEGWPLDTSGRFMQTMECGLP